MSRSRPTVFDRYEIVRVEDPGAPHIVLGYVNAVSEDERGACVYEVWVFATHETCVRAEHQLESTGRFVREEDVRSGVKLHVSGRGELIGVAVCVQRERGAPEGTAAHATDELQGSRCVVTPVREEWFVRHSQMIDQNVTHDERLRTRYTCPCCGYPTLMGRADYEICYLCDWQDDGQDDPHADVVWGGPNGDSSLSSARENFARHWIMYDPQDLNAPDSEGVRQAKKTVCEAFRALRDAEDNSPTTFRAALYAALAALDTARAGNELR